MPVVTIRDPCFSRHHPCSWESNSLFSAGHQSELCGVKLRHFTPNGVVLASKMLKIACFGGKYRDYQGSWPPETGSRMTAPTANGSTEMPSAPLAARI